jgi:hypothetical protein
MFHFSSKNAPTHTSLALLCASVFIALLVVVFSAFYTPIAPPSAHADIEPVSTAWSWNFGSISLTCENDGSCGTSNYKVIMDPRTGILSGYAWNDGAGWISFNASDVSGCPTPPCTPKLDSFTTNSSISGWAKALVGGTPESGGWDGWIELSGSWANPTRKTGTLLEGLAFEPQLVGWIEFDGVIKLPPDLQVTAVTMPDGAIGRTQNGAQVTVINAGETPAGAFTVSVDGTAGTASTFVSGGLAVGAQIVVTVDDIPIPGTRGTYTATATADPDDVVIEYYEGNNTGSTQYQAIDPDLTILDFRMAGGKPGDIVPAIMTVTNEGQDPAVAFRVGVSNDQNAVTQSLCTANGLGGLSPQHGTQNVSALNPGQTIDVQLTVQVPTVARSNPGYVALAMADIDCVVPEPDEADNTDIWAYNVAIGTECSDSTDNEADGVEDNIDHGCFGDPRDLYTYDPALTQEETPEANLSISATPEKVRLPGDTTTIVWSADTVLSDMGLTPSVPPCSVTESVGGTITNTWYADASTQADLSIINATTYTLVCLDREGKVVGSSVEVNVGTIYEAF